MTQYEKMIQNLSNKDTDFADALFMLDRIRSAGIDLDINFSFNSTMVDFLVRVNGVAAFSDYDYDTLESALIVVANMLWEVEEIKTALQSEDQKKMTKWIKGETKK